MNQSENPLGEDDGNAMATGCPDENLIRFGRGTSRYWQVWPHSYWVDPIYDECRREQHMIVVGLVLMLIGFLTGIPVLWSVGILVAAIGLVLLLLGAAGREVGGRRHYY